MEQNDHAYNPLLCGSSFRDAEEKCGYNWLSQNPWFQKGPVAQWWDNRHGSEIQFF
jgi:hypothetical protein